MSIQLDKTYSIFISAVSNELRSYRQEVARVLRRKCIVVHDQEYFTQGSGTLLERLNEYIQQCDAVILLIGDCCGGFPTEEHIKSLSTISIFEQYKADNYVNDVSYTQWEYLLAKYHGKKTYTYISKEGFKPDEPNQESEDLQQYQQVYRKWVQKHQGENYEPLILSTKLVENVLLLPFPDLSHPRPTNLPYTSLGSVFKGRDALLKDLRERFIATQSASKIIVKVLYGLGGIGKTRLAIEYALHYENTYNALLFVSGDSPEALLNNLANLCGPLVLNLPEQGEAEQQKRLAAVLRWLQQHASWFLIIDNVDTSEAAKAVEQLLSKLHGGHILITGRFSQWSRQVERIELDVLSLEDATDFLLERTKDGRRETFEDQDLAKAIAIGLGQLALALEQAGAYIETTRCTLQQYHQKWETSRVMLLEWFDEQQMQYAKSVAITWITSFEMLTEASRTLLNRLGWLAPEPVPESLLEVSVPTATPIDMLSGLVELARYSLVTRSFTMPTFTVHRLVQEVTRQRLSLINRKNVLREALLWLEKAFAYEPDDTRNWPILEPLAPHVMTGAQYGVQLEIASPTTGLLNELSRLLMAKAQMPEAEKLLRQALIIDEQVHGHDHAFVTVRLNNLANVLQNTGRLDEAEPLMRRALAISESEDGTDHPNVATRLNNLATLLMDTNHLEEAEQLLRRALEIDEQSYHPDHPNIARDLNNLAQLLHSTNRSPEAEKALQRTITIYQDLYGVNHPTVARGLNNLAGLFRDTNRSTEALALARQVLHIMEHNYSPDHPYVTRSQHSLAAMLMATNQLDEVESLLRQALTASRTNSSSNPIELSTSLNNLGVFLNDQGRSAEAEPMLREALSLDEDIYGSDHPSVARDLHNLAQVIKAIGHLKDAKSMMHRALSISELNHGKHHPDVAIHLVNLARLSISENHLQEAELLLRRTLSIFFAFERQNGSEHPRSHSAINEYRTVLKAIGKSDELINSAIDAIRNK
ncbi:tetratricopeptide repeat protein [Hymenobacter sp. GOD-10R]|uniref:tetratricopeptide repeat protein n=1 Tax=Hymenobacter sp. GOD-10R TaxID=3093922 RepID=UPI002D775B40|nr:tetratricopeptide repeat protein [Hymenobacter sp. GOD-10R]WRQ28139.1 tetratricopeptide repeat protein [Hymenobacter sp. GOD-10R]